MRTVRFSSKAKTLEQLSNLSISANIPKSFYFKVTEWLDNPSFLIDHIRDNFYFDKYIVRSSSQAEDQNSGSNAGAFLSVPDVSPEDLEAAINQVIGSYNDENLDNEVLIQPMLVNVVRSGVLFSHDPNNCSPYRVVNWSEGNDTSQITSGGFAKSWQQAAKNPYKGNIPHKFLCELMMLVEELLYIFEDDAIDCEFAFTIDNNKQEELWLLQVRPLVLHQEGEHEDIQEKKLRDIELFCKRGMSSHPFLKGRRTIYGVMPDWNPAEILGIKPKPLALSLYKEMVTDSIWAYQRHNYGYRNLRSFPLMPTFYGIPYIDVRVSFNSFIPAILEDDIANRLVDYYINKLLEEPTLHDKVEFEILFSCYTLNTDENILKLKDYGFSDNDISSISTSLKEITNNIIDIDKGLWKKDAKKIEILKERRDLIYQSNFTSIDKIYWLLEDAKRYGTLPFAGLARAGFIAVQILKSLVSIGILTEDNYDDFISSVKTVSGDIASDRATLDKSLFLSKYGHLRPGTYDILSQRYDENPDLYFNWDQKVEFSADHQTEFSLTLNQMLTISERLRSHGLNHNVVDLFSFLRSGIELREYAKFQFTKNLSDILSLIGKLGGEYGFSKEELAFSDINVFKEIHADTTNPKDRIQQSIDKGKQIYQKAKSISLPPLISSPEDIWSFQWPDTSPNFITQLTVTANIAISLDKSQIINNIVCIPNADPGFDWLFSYPIAGLVTAWGG
ncbi:phosphoenolpyruvate synthase, partial [bacterium]|nr:phosphoenolpyruvate synthase [bacterium]